VGVSTRVNRGTRPFSQENGLRAGRIEFLNMKTANALGRTVPLPLVGRADEVIE
jgi:hypothetical protein